MSADPPPKRTRIGTFATSGMGYGCMGMVAYYGDPVSDGEGIELLTRVYNSGITHFDTAEIYRSGRPMKPTPETQYGEVMLGKFLREIGRENVTIATKMWPGLWDNKCDLETVEQAVDSSLAKLGTDFIDLYYLHRLVPAGLEEWMHSVKALVAKGKIRNVGLSEASAENIRKAHALHPIAAVQQEWSLVTRNLEAEVVPCCAELGITVVAYSPLARSLLCGLSEPPPPSDFRTRSVPRFAPENFAKNQELSEKLRVVAAERGVSLAALCLAWIYYKAHKMRVNVLPIPGTCKLAHLEENTQALHFQISDEEAAQLEEMGSMCQGERGNAGYLEMALEGQSQ